MISRTALNLRPALLILAGLTTALAGCKGTNTLPTAEIVSPASGSTVYPGSVTFTGKVSDAETPAGSLVASFSAAGQSCTATASSDGTVTCALTLSTEAPMSVELAVADSDGGTGTASISIEVKDHAPEVSIQAPLDGQVGYDSRSEIKFLAQVVDPDDVGLECVWSSDIDGELGSAPVDPDTQLCSFTRSGLSGGTHYIQVQVDDAYGKKGKVGIYLPIRGCTDADGDGYTKECDADCNDQDPSIYPGANELCDKKDHNCDTIPDNGPDSDGDGFNACQDCDDLDAQTSPISQEVCDGKDNNCVFGADEVFDKDADGYTSCGGDCDDVNSYVNPGVSEVCDGIDNDCNQLIDDGAQITYFADADGDGFGDPNSPTDACEQPAGTVQNAQDCDDSDAAIKPFSTEACNGKDDDCNGLIDEGTTPYTYYPDSDGDGYGLTAGPTQSGCVTPSGFTLTSGDCNDADAAANPGATEVCDLKDNDCDASIDEDVILTFYRDVDGDGYGIASDTVTGCTAPSGYAPASGDCADADPAVNPNANEQCDSKDNDCDGVVDDNVTTYSWYLDSDKDGYGTNTSEKVDCAQPAGYVQTGGDCNDADPAINPAAKETCNGKDENCNGQYDEGVQTQYWQDADKDGYGGNTSYLYACTTPSGYVLSNTDCNDATATVYPGATELCDGLDNNCNSVLDEGQPQKFFYKDADKDGYGNPNSSISACAAPSGYVSNNTDCNDTSNVAYPGAKEVCDSLDNDCDSLINEGTECYDDDGDGWTENQGDCDDTDFYTNPTKQESSTPNGKDENCNGKIDDKTVCWDDDIDGFIEEVSATTCPGYAKGAYGSTIPGGGDCNDANAKVYPGAPEVFNGADENCDGKNDVSMALSAHPYTYAGDQLNAQAGFAVAGLGDVNNDGLPDIGIGAPQRNSKKGTTYVLFGKSSSWTAATLPAGGLSLDEDGSGAQGGYSLAGAGDVDSDGVDDFVVGAPFRSTQTYTEAGRMYLIYGGDALAGGQLSSVAAASADGVQNYVWLGYTLSGGRDMDGRGVSDVALGAPWPTTVANGYLMIMPGKTSVRYNRTIGISDLVKVIGNAGDSLGMSVAALGPTDSTDSVEDLVVSGFGTTSGPQGKTEAGVVYFVPGSSDLAPADSYIDVDEVSIGQWRGDGNDEEAGHDLADAGDVNGDGYSDVLMTVGKQVSTSPGLAYLVLGGTIPTGKLSIQSAADAWFTGEGTGCPCKVSDAGDVNGDDLDDFLVSVPNSTAGGTASGAVYLFYGRLSGLSGAIALSSANHVFIGAAGDRAGASVAAAGDINNDGYDDFLIGAPGYDATDGLTDAGRVFVVFGRGGS